MSNLNDDDGCYHFVLIFFFSFPFGSQNRAVVPSTLPFPHPRSCLFSWVRLLMLSACLENGAVQWGALLGWAGLGWAGLGVCLRAELSAGLSAGVDAGLCWVLCCVGC